MQLDARVDAALMHAVARGFGPDTPSKIGIAVSGGGDSMALLHLYMRWAQDTGHPIAAVTVDHTLRDGSDQEAADVAAFCAANGVSHDILTWDTWDGHGNVQAAARTARYKMIADWARTNDVTGVALGHTKDDSAETFVMRLGRKAGIDGLALMARQFSRNGLRWARPLWYATRADLRSYLDRQDVAWVDDPSNHDVDFERVRVRQALQTLDGLGITADVLHHAGHVAAQSRDALEYYTKQEADRLLTFDRGDVLMPLAPDIPVEIIRRLRAEIVQEIGGMDYPPRLATMNNLTEGLKIEGKQTVAGVLVTLTEGQLRFAREANAVKVTRCATDQIWDKRWQLDGPHAPDLHIAALGAAVKDCPDWRAAGLPRASLMASPAVWRADELVAAPLAGDNATWTAQIVADNYSSRLTH